MLYATKEMLDSRTATLVAAADTVEEFTAFLEAVKGQEDGKNWNELYASSFMDHMQNPFYKGFKHSVLAVYHDDEPQRDAFWTEWSLEERKSEGLRDRHLDMLHDKQVETRKANETEEDKTRTIEERFGLDKNDPWDRRSEEEVEADKKMKEQMKEMRQKGDISGDSFGGADAQRDARPTSQDVPGAYGRTKAVDALKTLDPETDFDSKTNEELKSALEEAGVPDVQGVYNDDEVPQRTVEKNGDMHIWDVRGERKEDGTLDIDEVLAQKSGGEVDEIKKAENEAAHNANVTEKKAGRKAFSPDDFAAVLRGDGSADAVTHEEGDNRQTRQATPGASRPSLSDHAEQARREHQEEQRHQMKARRTQAEKEADVKARGERDRGIFKGSDLHPDDMDEVQWDDLPENVRETLDKAGLKRDVIEVKNYPFNAELGGRAMLPFDGLSTDSGMRYVGGVNLTTEGTMTMGAPGVAIVSRTDSAEDGYGIYARKRMVAVKAEEGETPAASHEQQIGVWLVRVRAG
jgi:hypothetical protein